MPGCTSTRQPGRSRWSASTPWSRTPTRSSATSRASSSFRRPSVPAAVDLVDRACRKLRIFLDELVNGAPPVTLRLYPEYEAMQLARGVRAAQPTDLFYPRPHLARAAHPAARGHASAEAAVPAHQGAPGLPARPSAVAARRRGRRAQDARRRREHRGRDRAVRAALVLVERQRAVRGDRRAWRRRGLRAQAARRAHRPADPPRRRGQHQGRRPDAARGAVLRRHQRAGGSAGAGRAKDVRAGEPDSQRRDDRHRRRRPAASDPRGARAARRRQGHLAQVRVRARGEPAEAQADARLGARQGRPRWQRRADEARRGAGRAAGQDAVARACREPLAMEYATGAAARRKRVRELREPFAGVSAAGRRDDRAPRCRARRPDAAGAARAVLDEMCKRAQERLLLAQVGREIQANLRHMEQVLDAFFRDNAKRAELARWPGTAPRSAAR